MTPPIARTSAEAHLYLDLIPCDTCGQRGFSTYSAVVEVDGVLCSRYAGPCGHCGAAREFLFRLPAQVMLPLGRDPVFGGPEPSMLLDPGQWLAVADAAASEDPATGRVEPADLRYAAAALDEVVKFIPAGATQVPPQAVVSADGMEVYAQEPGRFARDRLAAVAQVYRDLAERAG